MRNKTLKGVAPLGIDMTCQHPDARELESGIEKSGIGCLTEWAKYECQDCGAIFHETWQTDAR